MAKRLGAGKRKCLGVLARAAVQGCGSLGRRRREFPRGTLEMVGLAGPGSWRVRQSRVQLIATGSLKG